MPNNLIEKLVKTTKKSQKELEALWDKAISEAKNNNIQDQYAYAASILENVAKDDGMAQDTMRSQDDNNFLTVKEQVITSEGVFPYLGKEIPSYEALGLDPNKIYKLYRPASEIKKGVKTFDNMPLLCDHTVVYYDEPPTDKFIGTLGNDVYFDDKDNKLKGTIAFWTKDAIDDLDDGKKGLSAAYRYTPVMDNGTYNGTAYDGIMTNLSANHVAHVDNPRDSSAIVNDSADLINNRSEYMNKYTKALMALDGELDEGSIADAIMDLMQSDSSIGEKKTGLIALLKKATKPAEDEDDKKEDKDKKPAEDEDDKKEDDKKEDKKPAMDSNKILELATKHVMEYQEAIKIGEKMLGGVNTIALDSADKIYNTILKQHSVDVKDLNLTGKKAMVNLIASQGMNNQTKIAMDSLSIANHSDAFSKQFEGVL